MCCFKKRIILLVGFVWLCRAFSAWAVPPEQFDFDWQKAEQHAALMAQVSALTEDQLVAVIGQITSLADGAEGPAFFQEQQNTLLSGLRSYAVGWLLSEDGPLGDVSFNRAVTEKRQCEQEVNQLMESGTDSDGFVGSETEKAVSALEDRAFPEWKDRRSWEDYTLSCYETYAASREELKNNPDLVSNETLEWFLENVEDGSAWLIDEVAEEFDIPGSLSEKFSYQINAPQELVEAILDSVWCSLDWNQKSVTDKFYLCSVYLHSLKELTAPTSQEGLFTRQRILDGLNAFLDHEPPITLLSTIRDRYNQAISRGYWGEAQRAWAHYTAYRAVTRQATLKRLKKKTVDLSGLHNAQQKKNLKEREDNIELYTKVYPHPRTEVLMFNAKKPRKVALLSIDEPLSKLKAIGKKVELSRPRNSINIFVPMLYAVISDRPHHPEGDHRRIFLEIPLDFQIVPGIANGVLNRHSDKGVFSEDQKTEFKDERKDTSRGLSLMGKDKRSLAQNIDTKESQELAHSERVLIKMLKQKETVKKIRESLTQQIKQLFGSQQSPIPQGPYKLYSFSMLGYSTNSVCPYCAPALVALQNSHEDGFLKLLVDEFNAAPDGAGISFKTRGYNHKTKTQDPNKLRLDIIVTAEKDFDPEATDFADEGDHLSIKGPKAKTASPKPPAKTHNPLAKLHFFQDMIDTHPAISPANPVSSEVAVPSRNFFYEFIGPSRHQNQATSVSHYPGVVLASGSDKWKETPEILTMTAAVPQKLKASRGRNSQSPTFTTYHYFEEDINALLQLPDTLGDLQVTRFGLNMEEINGAPHAAMYQRVGNRYLLPAFAQAHGETLTANVRNFVQLLTQRPIPLPIPQEIVVPYNPGGHWVTVRIRINETNVDIEYLESLYHENDMERTRRENRVRADFQHMISWLEQRFNRPVQLGVIYPHVQTDGAACGPITVQNIGDIFTNQFLQMLPQILENGAHALRTTQWNRLQRWGFQLFDANITPVSSQSAATSAML